VGWKGTGDSSVLQCPENAIGIFCRPSFVLPRLTASPSLLCSLYESLDQPDVQNQKYLLKKRLKLLISFQAVPALESSCQAQPADVFLFNIDQLGKLLPESSPPTSVAHGFSHQKAPWLASSSLPPLKDISISRKVNFI